MAVEFHSPKYDAVRQELRHSPRTWLVTGVAGFIGSNLLEALLLLDQPVVGLDDFATGKAANLDQVQGLVKQKQWAKFKFIEGDIRDLKLCQQACQGIDFVLHQAALGSVPRSIVDPILTNQSNVDGFLNMLLAARDQKVRRFIYAASSSTYGDHPSLPKVEDVIGKPLSPYAVTKYVNELYADVFARCYGQETIGLRYFNVFGPRQDPEGAYAAVIPRWVRALLAGEKRTNPARDHCGVCALGVLARPEDVEVAKPNRLHAVAAREHVGIELVHLFAQGIGRKRTADCVFDFRHR